MFEIISNEGLPCWTAWRQWLMESEVSKDCYCWNGHIVPDVVKKQHKSEANMIQANVIVGEEVLWKFTVEGSPVWRDIVTTCN